jgi:hypothetical protein
VSGIPLSNLVVLVSPVVVWLFVVATGRFRHPRFLLAMVFWTVAWFAAAAFLPDAPDRAARVVLAIVFGVGVFVPQRFGLLTVGGAEADADRILRRVSGWLGKESTDTQAAASLAASLSPAEFPVMEGDWAVAAALFRRSLLRRAGVATSTHTPVTAHERAARSFWRAGLERGQIGRQYRPDAWDEDVALRCYLEEFHEVIPREALVDHPVLPLGRWDVEAERVIETLTAIPLTDPIVREARYSLVAEMTDELAIARGDRSEQALARQRISAEQLNRQWAAMARHEERVKDARDHA